MKPCPKCGYHIKEPVSTRVLLELRYMARENRPLFARTLDATGETTDHLLKYFLVRGWIEQVGDKGFVLTAKGRRVARTGIEE